jgi:hypothetical protein
MSKRVPTTIYLDPQLARAAKVRAALNGETLSDIASRGIASVLERDRKYLEIFRKRRNSPTISYEEVLKRCKRDGLL